ncbi:DUF2218 domain-containing protein [Mycobacterium talmoniae]|uniref:DUF2218 domain-containing protein n=1 Tax=Mycobacterium talmoniae TaxID=1858794 RepID=A0A1S1NEN6_9MYCO|nr:MULTISPECIES: DUF2218 domain-containing protein [Mycobacterium]OHU98073.1 hypothetical protein BKN37_21320 [Mycobacterium talmoniae]PQM49469.1 hypothetical protein C1Y40_00307 [Mycobacterium talmoniae]TDH48773.1 DUF2218 domain-containing protein [Mycobacterium eburneum]
MTESGSLPSTHATVLTDRPDRYGKQLVAHLGRRNGGQWSPETGSGWIDLGRGRATVTARGDRLELDVVAPAEDLPRLEEVVASHLVRFGTHDELTVDWRR